MNFLILYNNKFFFGVKGLYYFEKKLKKVIKKH